MSQSVSGVSRTGLTTEVTLENVQVERGGRAILHVPSLQLRGGRTTAILGPNGSGKTTLLRLIAGLERPAQGHVHIGGSPVRRGQHLAYMFQEQVFLRQSVRENLELGMRLRGINPTERRGRVEEAAALLGIAHLLDRQANHLSGGEARRANLARALCMKAPLVLLDEPLEGLDEQTYHRLLDELPRVLAAFAATTLLVTHNRREALRLAQDLAVLVGGRILAAGEKHSVAMQPATSEVAEVLGYIVLKIDGRRIAVPPGAIEAGCAPVQFAVIIEEVIDLIDHREIVGRVGDVRVHVALPRTADVPQPGHPMVAHAERYYELG